MGFSSQSNDIGRICDAVVNGIKDDVASLTTAADSEVSKDKDVDVLDALQRIANGLHEVNHHLRIITGETPNERDI